MRTSAGYQQKDAEQFDTIDPCEDEEMASDISSRIGRAIMNNLTPARPVVSYMGTKISFASSIVEILGGLPSGPVLELFAGMSAVGLSLQNTRSVWANDVQSFSRSICEFQFKSDIDEISHLESITSVKNIVHDHQRQLASLNEVAISGEIDALGSLDWRALADFEIGQRTLYTNSEARELAIRDLGHGIYSLFTRMYASTYFGVRQCAEIDSIRFAIDKVAPDGVDRVRPTRLQMLASLASAFARCANSTGHFAQHLEVNERNLARVASKRRRCITSEWIGSLHSLRPSGSLEWRKRNRVYGEDAIHLLRMLKDNKEGPSIIYADPPYTSDQYSRYYHLYETLVNYDFPNISGKGLYRDHRFVSNWSLKTKIADSFEIMIGCAASLGSALVISYPEDGLLQDSQAEISKMLYERYGSVKIIRKANYSHSTMGASKGHQRHPVVEQIFVAVP